MIAASHYALPAGTKLAPHSGNGALKLNLIAGFEMLMCGEGGFPCNIEANRNRGSGKIITGQEETGLPFAGAAQGLDEPAVPGAVLGQSNRPMAHLCHGWLAGGADKVAEFPAGQIDQLRR